MNAENGGVMSFTIISDLACIHAVIQKVEEFIREHGAENAWQVSVVLRELLSNAIVHGNHNDPARSVQCEIKHVGSEGFRITVEDEGEGFDYASLDTSLPDDFRAIGPRGYILIRNLCSSVEFNKRGNRVSACVETPTQNRKRHYGQCSNFDEDNDNRSVCAIRN